MTMRENMARAMNARFVERRGTGDSHAFKADWNAMPLAAREFWLRFADAALDALMECAETSGMDGGVMNAMCAAFGWPEDAGRFPNPDGLTECCARAVTAFLGAAKEGK